MPFSVLPAIDVSGGRLGLLTADGPAPTDAFGGDPLAAATAFVAAGARWLHVVDMDLAFRGTLANGEVIAALAAYAGDIRPGERRGADGRAGRGPPGTGRQPCRRGLRRPGRRGRGDRDHRRSRPGETVLGIEVVDGRTPRSRRLGRPGARVDARMAPHGGGRALLVTAVDRVATVEGPDMRSCAAPRAPGFRCLPRAGSVRSPTSRRCAPRARMAPSSAGRRSMAVSYSSPRRSAGRRSDVRGSRLVDCAASWVS